MSDLGAVRVCPNELTRRQSIFNSLSDASICFQSAKLEQQTDWIPWTNEKHSSYLYSLETSFLNELHHSVYPCKLSTQKQNYRTALSPQEKNYGTALDSHGYLQQTTVDRVGQRQNNNFEGNEALSDSTADSHVNLKSTLVHHSLPSAKLPIMASGLLGEFREKRCMIGNFNISNASARSSQCFHSVQLCSHDYAHSSEEFSDQNFEDV